MTRPPSPARTAARIPGASAPESSASAARSSSSALTARRSGRAAQSASKPRPAS